MNAFFGEPWDVPATEGQPHVPTPVGAPCADCTLPIVKGDQGFLVSLQPWHRECLLRATIGSPAHLDGHCTCHGDDGGARPQTPVEMRAEAIEVWDRITSGRF